MNRERRTIDGELSVLIVASWFPSIDDVSAGRFIADQADALLAAGAQPAVASFETIRLTGGAPARAAQAEIITRHSRDAIRRARPLFVRPAAAVDERVPVARLSVADGLTTTAGAGHAAFHRRAVLTAVANRISGDSADAPMGRGVVHAHTGYPDGAAAVALAERLDWPLFVTEHASFVDRLIASPLLRDQYATMLSAVDRLFAVSEMLAGELRGAFPEHAAKIERLPNAVPVDTFRATGLADRVADELLFVGYRKASKGIETLLRAVAIAHAARPTIRLRLIGRPASQAEDEGWRRLAAELGILDAVTIEGATNRAGVVAAMGRASVFVHASPRETFGVVAVEALASGMPVVATDSGGVSEILGAQPERLGALTAVGDAAALAAAILQTLDRRATFDPAKLRASVVSRFSSTTVATSLIEAYAESFDQRDLRAPARPAPTKRDSRNGGDRRVLAGGAPDAVAPRPLVVALDRSVAARRLTELPPDLRDALTLVTSRQPGGVVLPHLGRVIEVDVEPRWIPVARVATARRPGWLGRLSRLASDPVGTFRRRTGADLDVGRWLAPAVQAIRDELNRADPGAVELIALEGHDVLAIEPVLGELPHIPSEGGLRRLADVWSAGRRT